MSHWWWKILGALLLLYVVIVGLCTPLAPQLVHRSVDRIKPGIVTVDVQGYNTHFTQGDVSVWVSNGKQNVCAEHVEVKDDAHLTATFQVPVGLKDEFSDLHASSGGDHLMMPKAFYTEGRGSGIIVQNSCQVTTTDAHTPFEFPNRNILNESIRNVFFHVPMWFAMVVVMAISVWKSIRYLNKGDLQYDRAALAAAQVGLLFGVFGLVTGSLWARVTWGAWWTIDVKLNGAAVGVLMYLAYLVLRGSVPDVHKRARLAAIYSIFAFCFLLLFIGVVPRLNAVDSLHPGNGGNPAFNMYDLDDRLKSVFYPACVGWILLSVWMYDLRDRLMNLASRHADANDH